MNEILNLLWAYVLVFILSAVPMFEVLAVVPLAILGGLAPVPVLVLSILGNLIAVLLIILFANKIRSWRRKRKAENARGLEGELEEEGKRSARARKLFNKYGLPGLSLIGGPFVTSHLAAFLAISFGGTKKATTVWMTISIVLWAIVMAIVAIFAADLLADRLEGLGFLRRMFDNE
ncbi:small multi-drug export protein [Bacillus horti]|uniref:Membrane protein n=1 Tax=Caldalkalibacillus horti TaxID=77523 RepID=A0ABT9VWK9_9BACI|nr:small multi-drug export protein [Bacillus horti]MDQ0165373.1 putative membrane protein [Bacillus horti]